MNEVPVNKRLNAWAAGAARFALAAAVALGAVQAAHAKTSLLVYTALEDEAMKPYKDAFEKANPDIEIRWVRDSTGSVTAKLLAEKNNPRADVVLGLAASSLTLLDLQGMLMPYTPTGFDQLTRKYSDANTPPHWVGMDVWGATICYNRVAAQAKGIPKPTSWEDLTKPVYKGAIVMPAGLVRHRLPRRDRVAADLRRRQRLEIHGRARQERRAIRALEPKPCTLAGTGEFPIGISFEFRGHELQSQGAPIDLVFPKEGRLGHGRHRDHEDDEAARRREEAGRLHGEQGGEPDHRALVGDRRVPGCRAQARRHPRQLLGPAREE